MSAAHVAGTIARLARMVCAAAVMRLLRHKTLKRSVRILLYFCIIAAGVVLDQVTKAWARTALAAGSLPFIPGILELRLIMNTGAAFSIGSGSTWIFIILASIIVAAATVWVIREKDMPLGLTCALGAVSAGGIGNLIDRVVAGKVTDFLATTFIDFPIFNVADIFVTVGVIVALICLLFWNPEEDNHHSDKGDTTPKSDVDAS